MRNDASPNREALYRRLHALLLGGVDMHDVFETAHYLRDTHSDATGHADGMPWRARRTLESGMFVAYARPFVDGRGRGLPQLKRAQGLTAELRDSHVEILRRRDNVYAHTGDASLRQILELTEPCDRAAWVRDQGDLSEQWFPPTPELLDDVVMLAAAHLESFLAEIEEVRVLILATENALTAQAAR